MLRGFRKGGSVAGEEGEVQSWSTIIIHGICWHVAFEQRHHSFKSPSALSAALLQYLFSKSTLLSEESRALASFSCWTRSRWPPIIAYFIGSFPHRSLRSPDLHSIFECKISPSMHAKCSGVRLSRSQWSDSLCVSSCGRICAVISQLSSIFQGDSQWIQHSVIPAMLLLLIGYCPHGVLMLQSQSPMNNIWTRNQ